MKQLFRGLCLLMCIHAYAFCQTESVTNIVLETDIPTQAGVWYPFGVAVDVLEELEEQGVYKVADGILESYVLNDVSMLQTGVVAFVADSGLYSGFGTAWHRNYPSQYKKGFELLNDIGHRESTRESTVAQINLSSLFKTSLIFNDGIDVPFSQSNSHSFSSTFSQPLVQVSLGYRNSF